MAKQYVAKTPNGFSMKVTQMLFVPEAGGNRSMPIEQGANKQPPSTCSLHPNQAFPAVPCNTVHTHLARHETRDLPLHYHLCQF